MIVAIPALTMKAKNILQPLPELVSLPSRRRLAFMIIIAVQLLSLLYRGYRSRLPACSAWRKETDRAPSFTLTFKTPVPKSIVECEFFTCSTAETSRSIVCVSLRFVCALRLRQCCDDIIKQFAPRAYGTR